MKFKRVEIQAFKTYLEKQDGTFDFTVDGIPANIVSLYAPNGFGKTSFYDAIDFCITNNITRFIRPGLATQNNEQAKALNKTGQKQFILRNQSAPMNMASSIEISTTDGDYQSQPITARTNYKDYQFEPKNTPPNRMYFRDILLSQETIDAFLREDGPEERYQKFMLSQVNEQTEYENKRQSIQLILSSLGKRRKGFENDLKEINKKQADVVLSPEVFETANQLVAKLKQYDLPQLNENFNAQTRHILDNRIAKYKSELQVTQAEVIQQHQILTGHRDNLPLHLSKLKDIQATQQQLSTITQARENKKSQFNESFTITAVNTQLKTNQEQLEALKSWKNTIPKINTVFENINKLEEQKDQTQQELQQLKNNIAERTSNEKQLQQHQQGFKTDKDRYDALAEDSIRVFKDITTSEQALVNNENTKQRETIKLTDIKEDLATTQAELQQVKQFSLQNSSLVLSSPYTQKNLTSLVTDYKKTVFQLEQLEQSKRQTAQKLKEANEQSDTIAELIRVGAEIIAKGETSICPLCKHDHRLFKTLSDRVNSNSSLSDIQKTLMTELQNIQAQLTENQQNLENIQQAFDVAKNKRLATLKALVLDKSRTQAETDKKLKETTWKIESNLKILQPARQHTFSKSQEEYNGFLQAQSTHMSEKLQQVASQLSELNKQKQTLEQNHDATQLTLASDNTRLEQAKQSELYLSFQQCLNSFALPLQTNTTTFVGVLDERMISLALLIDENQQKITQSTANLTQLQNQLQPEFINDSTEALTVRVNAHQENLTTLQNEFEPFSRLVAKLNLRELLEQDDWTALSNGFTAAHDNLLHLLTSHNQTRADLTLLAELFDKVLSYLAQVKAVDKINQLKEDIEKIANLEIPLKADLKKVEAFLQEKINQYFHTDLINNIYAKIDPHPDFKKIRFVCEMPKNAKPRLQVYVEGLSSEEIISPTLHFSSAQINVLSLSIFLAKTISTTDAEGKPVDCIFIDDPIQSMDAINVLGTIDLLRNLAVNLNKQIIISTHNESFHSLLEQKIPPNIFKSKFLELESFGKVAAHENSIMTQ